jgi:hypothetical protein
MSSQATSHIVRNTDVFLAVHFLGARLSADDGSHRGEPTAANGSIGCFRSFVSATFGHLSLLRCRPFALLVIANILYSFGYHIPYAYMPDRARHVADVDPDRAAALISIMGSASVCGRLFGGLAFIECRRRSADVDGNDSRGSRRCSAASMRFVVTVATMVGSGLTTALVFAMTEFWSMVIYAVLTGVFGGQLIVRPFAFGKFRVIRSLSHYD